MKKRFLIIFSFLAFFSLFAAGYKAEKVEAVSQYGIVRKFTTPKATRGTWYYRQKGDKNIYKVKITAHTAAGDKLYVRSEKFFKNHVDNLSHVKRNAFIKKVMKKNIYVAYKYKNGFNVNNWVDLAGDGVYYLPASKKVNGKKVKALQLATGAGPYNVAYAYKSKALVKAAK